jgi:hypothetical protein
MERRGEWNAVAERMRAEHQARVEARVQNAAAQFSEAASVRPAAPRTAQSLEDIRRQARENWLRLREQQNAASNAPSKSAGRARTLDDDLGR